MAGKNQATPPIVSELRAIATVKPKTYISWLWII
jgi:hypothetical protein